MNRLIICAVTLAAGLSLGAIIDHGLVSDPRTGAHAEVSSDAVTAEAGGSPQSLPSAAGPTSAPDLASMRAMIREELALALAKPQAGGQVTPVAVVVPAAAPAISAEQQREAMQSVEAMISGGRWGNEERNAFHQKLALLDPQQREQATQRLVQAIDAGSIKVSGGPML
jgi:hypothetical protein